MNLVKHTYLVFGILTLSISALSVKAQDDGPVFPTGNPYFDQTTGNSGQGIFSSNPDPFGTGTTTGSTATTDNSATYNVNSSSGGGGVSSSSFGPGGPDDPNPDVNAPIDGGVSLLLVAGAAAGVKLRNKKKKQQQQAVIG